MYRFNHSHHRMQKKRRTEKKQQQQQLNNPITKISTPHDKCVKNSFSKNIRNLIGFIRAPFFFFCRLDKSLKSIHKHNKIFSNLQTKKNPLYRKNSLPFGQHVMSTKKNTVFVADSIKTILEYSRLRCSYIECKS